MAYLSQKINNFQLPDVSYDAALLLYQLSADKRSAAKQYRWPHGLNSNQNGTCHHQ